MGLASNCRLSCLRTGWRSPACLEPAAGRSWRLRLATGPAILSRSSSGEARTTGIHRLDEFRVTKLDRTASSLTAYLMHDRMPMALALLIRVEGHVATFSGQAFWNGDVPLEADIYYPLLSGLRFESPEKDRALLAQISGSVLENLGTVNYWNPYVGSLSSPVFEVEGGGRGLAFSDDNRADFAADPGAASLHGVVIGNVFPPAELPLGKNQPKAGLRWPLCRYSLHARVSAHLEVRRRSRVQPRRKRPRPAPGSQARGCR